MRARPEMTRAFSLQGRSDATFHPRPPRRRRNRVRYPGAGDANALVRPRGADAGRHDPPQGHPVEPCAGRSDVPGHLDLRHRGRQHLQCGQDGDDAVHERSTPDMSIASVVINSGGTARICWVEQRGSSIGGPGDVIDLPAALRVPNTSLIVAQASYEFLSADPLSSHRADRDRRKPGLYAPAPRQGRRLQRCGAGRAGQVVGTTMC